MVLHEALSVFTADRRRVARIGASVVDAGCRLWTIEVREAVARLLATRLEGIPHQAVRTDAGERSLSVLTTAEKPKLQHLSQRSSYKLLTLRKNGKGSANTRPRPRRYRPLEQIRGSTCRVQRGRRRHSCHIHSSADYRGLNSLNKAIKESSKDYVDLKASSLTAAFVSVLIAVLVRGTVVVRETLDPEATRRVADVAGLALAGSSVVHHRADCVRSAVAQRAGVGAVALDAGLRIGTIGVHRALMRNHAARASWIASGALRTGAAIGSFKIDALCARVAGIVVALVNVEAVLWSSDKSMATSAEDTKDPKNYSELLTKPVYESHCIFNRHSPAFVVDANFVVVATGVRCAADLAETVDAEFSGQTVAVAVTDLDADAVLAAFPFGTVVLFAALALTESRDAQVLAGTVLGTVADIGHSDAALLRRGVPVEAERTGARDGVVGATADRVWTTDVFPFAGI